MGGRGSFLLVTNHSATSLKTFIPCALVTAILPSGNFSLFGIMFMSTTLLKGVQFVTGVRLVLSKDLIFPDDGFEVGAGEMVVVFNKASASTSNKEENTHIAA